MIATKPITYPRQYSLPVVEQDGRLWHDDEPLPIMPPVGFDDGELLIHYDARHTYEPDDPFLPHDVQLTPTGIELRNGHARRLSVSLQAEVAVWEMYGGRIYEKELTQ